MTLSKHAAAGLAAALMLAACSTEAPPDLSDGAPVVNRSGEVVGTADPEEMDRAAGGGDLAEVYRNGELVGHFGPDGFTPVAEQDG